MNRALACAAAALICASCESRSPEPVESATEGPASAAVETGWPVHGGTTSEQRFSPLAQIDKDTIADLKPAWYVEFDTNRGQEATPLVVDGVLYTSTAWSKVYAVDAKTGDRVWYYDPKVPGATGVKACCDVNSRGLAVAGGKVFVATLDGRLIALDQKTGTPLWSTVTVDQNAVLHDHGRAARDQRQGADR